MSAGMPIRKLPPRLGAACAVGWEADVAIVGWGGSAGGVVCAAAGLGKAAAVGAAGVSGAHAASTPSDAPAPSRRSTRRRLRGCWVVAAMPRPGIVPRPPDPALD